MKMMKAERGITEASSPTIGQLLARQRVRLLEGSVMKRDPEMQLTWRRLWSEFGVYVDIREHLHGERACKPFYARSMSAASLMSHLVNVGLLTLSGGGFRVADSEASRLLRGGWLEELGAMAALEAGAEEVRYGQKLGWTSRYEETVYQNEVDVLARFGDQLTFVSCKALAPRSVETGNGTERIFDAMKEVSYWRQHFGAGQGRAVLLTTADFIDERRHRPRNAALLEHADVLGVRVVSADAGDWRGLLEAFRKAAGADREP